MKDLQLYSWVKETDMPADKSILLTGWASTNEGERSARSRCVLKDFATTVRDDVFAPTPSPLSVRGLLLYAAWFDLRVETEDLVCAFMHSDSSCEMFARPLEWQLTKLVVIKRREALNPRIPVVYLGFEYRSLHEGERREFTVKPTAQYVDECLDIVQLQNAKAVMRTLTEQKSMSLHGDTTVCDQVQHSLFRGVVGKLQYITGVRPDLMFVTKCLSYKLASPTLADLTRAKKAVRYSKGTRELNLHLTIPALKPNDLNRTLKHVTGYSDADWAGDPMTRKSTSCTLWCVDQFLQGTVALSSGESELYALGALSVELIFAQATLEELGLSFPDTRESRQQHSTRSGNETRSESQDETHSHEIPVHLDGNY